MLISLIAGHGMLAGIIAAILGGSTIAAVLALFSISSVGLALAAVGKFFTTPLGQIVAVVLLCAACVFGGEIHRSRVDSAAWASANLESKLAAQKRDTDIANAATVEAKAQTQSLMALASIQDQKVSDYEKALASRPVCSLGADDVRRLRVIAGQPAAPGRKPPARLRIPIVPGQGAAHQ